MKYLAAIILTLWTACCAFAQQQQQQVIVHKMQQNDTLEVYFRQGQSLWVPQYRGNGERLQEFVERFGKLHSDKVFNRISKIHIVAGCSPEGSWTFNQKLSKNRVIKESTFVWPWDMSCITLLL